MGGHQVHSQGSGDDGFDEDGYDESQRAEILEATGDGPTDGAILTDINPDLGQEPLDDDEDDDLEMLADETADVDDDAEADEDDLDEDDAQAAFDNGTDDPDSDEELTDGEDVALRP